MTRALVVGLYHHSILEMENQKVVIQFLNLHTGFELQRVTRLLLA